MVDHEEGTHLLHCEADCSTIAQHPTTQVGEDSIFPYSNLHYYTIRVELTLKGVIAQGLYYIPVILLVLGTMQLNIIS